MCVCVPDLARQMAIAGVAVPVWRRLLFYSRQRRQRRGSEAASDPRSRGANYKSWPRDWQLSIANFELPIGSWQLWQTCGQRAKAKYAANSRWPDTDVDVDVNISVSVSVDCNGGQRRLLQLRCGQSGSKLIHVPWLIAANRGSAQHPNSPQRERETEQESERERERERSWWRRLRGQPQRLLLFLYNFRVYLFIVIIINRDVLLYCLCCFYLSLSLIFHISAQLGSFIKLAKLSDGDSVIVFPLISV